MDKLSQGSPLPQDSPLQPSPDTDEVATPLEPAGSNWMAHGNCNNHPPSVFFPSDGVGVEIAKKICNTCPVKEQCLEYALEHRVDHGVWGAASERQRRRILKQRRKAKAKADSLEI